MEKRNEFTPPLTALEIASFLFSDPQELPEYNKGIWIWNTPMTEFTTKKSINQELKEVNSLMSWSWKSPFKEFNMENLLEYKAKLKKRLQYLNNPIKNDNKLLSAKAVPMSYFIEFDRRGKAKCPLHTEKDGSLHYYKNDNTAFCFSCRKRFDTVEIVKVLFNLEFMPAINKILGR